MQALVQQHSLCRLSGRLRQHGVGAGEHSLSFRNPRLPEAITVRSDAQGEFASLSLPTGLSYAVYAGERQIDQFSCYSGTAQEVDFDLSGAVRLLRVQVPERVSPGKFVQAKVELVNYADSARDVVLHGYGYRINPREPQRSLTLTPGRQQIDFPFQVPIQAGAAPYAVILTIGQQEKALCSASGIIAVTPELLTGTLLEINGNFANPVILGADSIPTDWKKIMGPGIIKTVPETDAAIVEISAEKTIQLHSRHFALNPGTIVKLRFMLQNISHPVLPIAGIHLYDAKGQWLAAPAAKSFSAVQGQWKSFELLAKIPASVGDRQVSMGSVCVGINGSGSAQFKQVSVELLQPALP